jgi:hypothetical protein
VNVETKEQSMQWMHIHSPNKQKTFKQMSSATKLMAAVFWDRKGLLMVKFMQLRDHNNVRSILQSTKNTAYGHSEQKALNADMQCSTSP